jgi:HEAT repeat protein
MSNGCDRQLDLFAGAGQRPDQTAVPAIGRPRLVPPELDDKALVAAIPSASLGDCRGLAAEAGRRRLAAAIPALEALCRRFCGFGVEQAIPEQAAALEALATIGGREAAQAVMRMIIDQVVQGPGLKSTVAAAATLGASLPSSVAASLLRHPAPEIRASACRCAGRSPAAIPLLVELLDDADHIVAREAACTLGRMGRHEARLLLLRLLREQPSAAVIDAVSSVADEECLVVIGRIAQREPHLANAAFAALEAIGSSRAMMIAAAARRLRQA